MDTRQSKLVGTSHELQFGVHGSRIRSIQGNVDPDSRVATDEDDVLEILERESDEHAVLRLQDIRSVNGNVFGTFIIDDEINAGGLPGSPTDGTYALVTATWTTYTKNEIWRWSAEKAAWVKLSIQFGKFMIVRKSGGITGYSEGVLYYYNPNS